MKLEELEIALVGTVVKMRCGSVSVSWFAANGSDGVGDVSGPVSATDVYASGLA